MAKRKEQTTDVIETEVQESTVLTEAKAMLLEERPKENVYNLLNFKYQLSEKELEDLKKLLEM